MIGFGGDPGFDVTFSIMRIMVPVMFVLVFGIIIVTMVRGVGEWNKNNHSPKLTVPVTVVAKRSDVDRGIETMHTFTSYYVTFQVESGDRMEFEVSDMEYGMLAEGDSGELTFQGTRYLNFQRNESAE
ncbi:DUF2500 domain-containing protein [Dysosmobacter sp.]|uniref:DUF2500 domain-containing protein n=1 Tax=Dysosmobacter sp. TaxID=2591382 RepID=UPI003A8FD097